jgi:putative phosphoesterase
MKLAILSDIHGNHYALQKVLLQAKIENVEKLLILGDIVGYYYKPDTVLNLLQDWDYSIIKGNHEELLEQVVCGNLDLNYLNDKYGHGHSEAISLLTKKQIDQLINLPNKLELLIDNLKILMSHGSPSDKNLYLYPDTDYKTLNSATQTDYDYVLIGHSHYQFLHRSKNTILLNPGSVGQSRSMGGQAEWAILDTENEVIKMKTTVYDTSKLLEDINFKDPNNKYLKSILIRNSIEKV